MASKRFFALGNRYLFVYLAFLSAFAPLATDMYLPALPGMTQTFGVSNGMISLTITMFLLFFGTAMLIWGPLADRYGRKPILFWGSLIFVFSSVAIALTDNVWALLAWRCVEGAGAGAASCTSLAIVKDLLRGSMMERIVSWMQAATVLAPMIAPVLGGGILMLVNWRGIFWVLAICGLISLLGAMALRETSPCDTSRTVPETFRRIFVVLGDRKFRDALIIFSLSTMPFFSFLAVSAFLYQDQFAVSPQVYSLFFAFNASISLAGPFAHLWGLHKLNRPRLICCYFALMTIAGAALVGCGFLGKWVFALLFAVITFCGSAMRPPSTVLIMQCIPSDNGVVSSLINFGHLILGSLAMLLAALPFWPSPTMAVGCISFLISLLCACWWWKIRHNY